MNVGSNHHFIRYGWRGMAGWARALAVMAMLVAGWSRLLLAPMHLARAAVFVYAVVGPHAFQSVEADESESEAESEGEKTCSGILSRQEIEGTDGKAVKLLRVLEDPSVRVATSNTTAVPVSFWDAGPSAADLKTWHDKECATCADPPGFDEVDGTIDRLQEVVDFSRSLRTRPIDDVVGSWQTWITFLYDVDRTDDFDDTLKAIAQGGPAEKPPVKGLPGWRSELIDIRDRGVAKGGLPLCAITSPESTQVTIDNSPCTINQPRKEEFKREFANTRDFLGQLTDPHSKFYHDLIINRILLPELPGRLSVYLVGADKIRNLEATIDTIEIIDGVLTYTFTSTFEFFDDYAAHDWVPGENHGQGTVAIPSLELGGSPATNGLITYTFVWSFISYDVPKPVPTIVPGPVIVEHKITSWSSVVWTWTMEQAEFTTAQTFHHHLEMPKPYTCDYSLENHCSASPCQGDVCIGLGDCSAVRNLLTPPGVVNPPGLSDTIPVLRLDDPTVDVSCADPPVMPPDVWGCPDPGSPYLLDASVGCTLVNPHPNDIDQTVGCCGGGSGTVDIDDKKPVGTGLTISPVRAVNAPVTVQNFADGVDAFDAFVNGIPPHSSCKKPGEICFGSSNVDTADEFVPVLDALAAFIGNIETFRTEAKAFSDHMWKTSGQFGIGQINPVTYRWRDSQGNHSVAAEVGNFQLAQTRRRKKGNWLVGKVCLRLEDYQDDGTNTWVKITQKDPKTNLGLWTWNPFGGAICKQACASYSFDRVGLANCPVKNCP